MGENIPLFNVPDGLKGHNNSKQYIANARYISAITSQPEMIKIEIGLRENLLQRAVESEAKTLLLDPFKNTITVKPISVASMSFNEAYAEKVRAALTRKEPAIRDFFDIDFAVMENGFDLQDNSFLELVRAKLSIPDNDPIDTSAERKEELVKQLETQLKPVLRSKEYEKFELERAFSAIVRLSASL